MIHCDLLDVVEALFAAFSRQTIPRSGLDGLVSFSPNKVARDIATEVIVHSHTWLLIKDLPALVTLLLGLSLHQRINFLDDALHFCRTFASEWWSSGEVF